MSNRSIGIVLSIIIAATIFAIYFFINDFNQKKADTADLIPTGSLIVLKVNEPGNLLEELSEKNQVWKSLDSTHIIYRLLDNFKSIDSVLQLQPGLREQLLVHPFYLAVLPDKNDQIQTLFIQEIEKNINLGHIEKFISEHFKEAFLKRPQADILLIETNRDSLYLQLKKGVITFASTIDLLKDGRRNELKSDPSFDSEQLNSFIKSSPNKTDARLLINYKAFRQMQSVMTGEKGEALLQLLSHFAGFTETDIKIKKDEILFSGFSSVDSGTFLERFRGQVPLPNKVVKIIPFNTTFLFNQCFSDFGIYTGITVPEKYKNLSAQIGHEVALLNNAASGDELNQATYVVAALSNELASQQAFIEYGRATGSRFSDKQGAFSLYKINDNELLENLFGKLFSDVTENWFSFIEDYIVFANSKESLVNFIRFYNTGKTLDLNENFKMFSDNISTKSNILIYCQPDAIIPFSKYFVNKNIAGKLNNIKENINDIQGIAIQFSAGDNLFYSSFYLKHNKSIKTENLALWKVQLDDEVLGKPTLVWDHDSKNYNIVAFDKLANIYLINAHGQIQWKKRIDDQPLGDIFEVDYFKNGKIQYLFNTKDFLYIIDKNGDFVESYPIKISPSATNGVSLFDYKNNKDYRLLVAQADKKVYNYNIKGDRVKGWNTPKAKDMVAEEITRIVAGNKDYFIITDISNNVMIVNRRGNERIKLKDHFSKARNSLYYENQTNSKGIIITTDNEGKLVYISASGALQFTEFAKFSPQHYFLYKDFKGDGVNEFIYLDGRALKVFDRFKKVLFSYEFNSDINQQPVIFDLGRKTKALGVLSSVEKTIYLFDQKGNTIVSKGIVGETPFTVGSIHNDNELNLITASGNVLYNYRIK
ncbi:MAG: hypothetical protein V2I62_02545 [Bacteroidales bacterium]|jgi:hypothetical protein|nr:hypothetical protein [Bacteroidales bacterium]